jgi:hypothetical protein
MDQTPNKSPAPKGFWDRMQTIDRRIIYVVLFVILTVFMAIKVPTNITPTSNAYRLYKAVEQCPDDGVILIMGMWGFGTQGENWPQYEALVYHCLSRGKKFAVASSDAVAISKQNQIIENRAADIERRTGRRIVYGRDWVNLGFKLGGAAPAAYYTALADNVREFFGNRDFKNNDLSKLPIMENIRNAGDFYMVFEVAAGLEGIYVWVGIIRPKYPHTLYAGAVTAIVAPDAYPYVDSGQLAALIDGYRGAAEYEKLIGFEDKGRGHRQANAQSWAHILIFVLLVLGNVGYFMTRRTKQ